MSNKLSGETDSIVKGASEDIKAGLLKTVSTVGLSAISLAGLKANAKDKVVWTKVDLPTSETLFDISFDSSKPEHGWLVGAKGTFLETFDGGDTWKTRSFSNLDEDV